ncbi:hypothetical protein [Streptomyces griseosporeus]|uniref:hypothetical protein n=1 Tax=Streptomyces griseosporeus TaxID=1910 RepID=UPI00167C803E|nr:hypothetical protein [Streptomyces griseosporeus]GHF92025.1 hypothetical protein GCM10018783_73560 [Streptomyces griseosporeus]
MGSYTNVFKLYKPAPTEFVDVETQLNRNWEIIDKNLKRLLEYEYVPPDQKIPDLIDVPYGRYYKPYSNSVPSYYRSGTSFVQDPWAFVSTWTPVAVNSPYSQHPDHPVMWRIIRRASSPTTAKIEWTGAFWLGGSNLPLNTNVTNIITLPSLTIPTTGKYFTMHAGNAAPYSIARVGFFSVDVQYKRYGGNPTAGSDENRIDLYGIEYNVEVTG